MGSSASVAAGEADALRSAGGPTDRETSSSAALGPLYRSALGTSEITPLDALELDGEERVPSKEHQASQLNRTALLLRIISPLAVLLVVVGAWQVASAHYGPLLVPSPGAVWNRFVLAWQQGIFWPAAGTTISEAGLGWSVAVLVALPIGYALGRWSPLEVGIGPYMASSQAMPVVAIAPLLVLWLGFGVEPKIVVAALIAFFPIAVTTSAGIRGIHPDLQDVARVFGAGWWQRIIYLEAPAATRAIFSGAKIAAALSVTGAFVGELTGTDQGLGYLIQFGQQNFQASLVFVGVLSLMITGGIAYGVVASLERVVLHWAE